MKMAKCERLHKLCVCGFVCTVHGDRTEVFIYDVEQYCSKLNRRRLGNNQHIHFIRGYGYGTDWLHFRLRFNMAHILHTLSFRKRIRLHRPCRIRYTG